MGKIVTIYLSDDEASKLREFCDGNRCTQYSARAVVEERCARAQLYI